VTAKWLANSHEVPDGVDAHSPASWVHFLRRRRRELAAVSEHSSSDPLQWTSRPRSTEPRPPVCRKTSRPGWRADHRSPRCNDPEANGGDRRPARRPGHRKRKEVPRSRAVWHLDQSPMTLPAFVSYVEAPADAGDPARNAPGTHRRGAAGADRRRRRYAAKQKGKADGL
jgi:hypothetical protein